MRDLPKYRRGFLKTSVKMSHFNLENEINDATRLDAPLERGPLARWQRKALEAGVKSLSLDAGLNLSGLSGPRSGVLSGKTPRTPLSSRRLAEKVVLGKTPNGRTPGNCRTPSKTPGLLSKTPNKTPGNAKNRKVTNSKTPNKSNPTTPHHGQDRFIPNRSAMDLETGHYVLTSQPDGQGGEGTEINPDEASYSNNMSRALSEGNLQDHKILAFQQKPPKAKEGYLNNLKVLYSGNSAASARKGAPVTRHIPQTPERIMDAPSLVDDYYLNLLSWSANNHLTVALGNSVYLWNAGDGSVTQLPLTEDSEDYVSSVSWVKEGNFLAVGDSSGSVQLWDVGQMKLMRVMRGHAARVGSLSWNSYIISSGSRTGAIYHHDVRVAEHHVGTLRHHTQEVCGLQWSPDGRHLASGANDNQLCVWDGALGHSVAPVHTFTEHQAAVKALSWCPWQPNLLASGGGTADRHIRFWNVTTGSCINSIDTNSQVCALAWSKEHKELISGHGFSQNQLTIWKYPSLARVTNLLGHESRILCLAQSPDGSTIASAAADETVRLWKCFAVDKQTKTTKSKSTVKTSSSVLMKGIR